MSVEFDGRTQLPDYIWPTNEICEMGGLEEEICECDKQVATALLEFQDENGELQAPNNNFDLLQCERGPGDGDGGDGGVEFCCKRRQGAYQMYNGNRFCCEFENLLPAGSCVVDEGVLLKEKLFV